MKSNFSQNVCRQLAEQLLEEQTQVHLHEAVVNDIKKRIINEKMKSIRKIVGSKLYCIVGKKYMVTNIHMVETDNGGCAVLSLAWEPNSAEEHIKDFNEKEAKLMSEYRETFDFYKYMPNDNWEIELSKVAKALAMEEHGYHLLDVLTSDFDFCEATTTEFFEKTGVYIDDYRGTSCDKLMLEDVVVTKEFKKELGS